MLIQRGSKSDRPPYQKESEPFHWIMDIVSLGGLALFWGYFIWTYRQMPDQVPTHFDAAGAVNDWGSKGTLWLLPSIAAVIFVGFTLLSRIPEKFNYAVTITPENAQRQYSMALKMIAILKTVIIYLFLFIYYTIAQMMLRQTKGMGPWTMPIVLGVIFIPLIIYLVHSFRHK
jgi:uncharacterized membrane protein